MSIDSKCDNKIHANICAAIKSLSMQNKFAFAPAFSAEERHIMAKVSTKDLKELYNKLELARQDKDISDSSDALKLMVNTLKKVENQMSECFNVDSKKISTSVINFLTAGAGYSFHKDITEYYRDGKGVRVTLALKGEGTSFLADQAISSDQLHSLKGGEIEADRVINTPDLHLSVFTIGEINGAIHATPICKGSLGTEDCMRYLVLISSSITVE